MFSLFRHRPVPAASSPRLRRATRSWRENVLDYLHGAGTVIDPLPIADDSRAAFRPSDRDALASDWRAIGQDMRQATQSTHAAPSVRSRTSDATATIPDGPANQRKSSRHSSQRSTVDAI
jgi:hypothetical protein